MNMADYKDILANTHFEAQVMPGGHAGLTEEESRIPFIAVEKD